MSIDSYRIEDEPTPGTLSSFAVNPLWPFVAVMFGGVWLSWSWFLLNSLAVGSPTRKKEIVWIVSGLIVSTALVLVILFMVGQGIIQDGHLKYYLLIITVWKLAVTYSLFNLQSHTIELYEYYGGQLKNGVFIVIAAVFVSPAVTGSMPPVLRLVLG